MGILTALALASRIIANPLANLIQKKLSVQGKASLKINFHTYLILAILSFGFLMWRGLPIMSSDLFFFTLLTGIFGAIGNGLLVKSLEHGELSVMGPINSYKPIVAMVVAIFLLSEVPTLDKVPGVFLTVFGSYYIIDKGDFHWRLFARKDIQYRFLSMIFTATEAVFLKKLIQLSDVYITFSAWAIAGAFFAFVYQITYSKEKAIESKFELNYLSKIGMIALAVLAMQFTTIYVFETMQVAYALALFQLSVLVSILLGVFFFHEKNLKRKILGSVIMILGSLIILLN
ncbi:DMT family transporter [Jiulongibacter sediminis]|uniref:EamA domain-containing protein n=1 Tax=Jiulongibacter sediminis TaxID=1605367 RepID=A0A0P7C482_9BACT|nr:DMT family transporter [Jiulongibacter sediminis]KPM49466.1 hypothetical protein AFM12_02330 [Jiulongibacter sediminis]TBX26514.1 hypothetical protein TK44_02335 [Jiulongibacter sediminis]